MRVDGPAILAEAFLFDMDGTLTEPLLDFPRIKAEMGIGNRPILEALAEMDDGARAQAEKVLHRHEDEAAARSTLNAGCHELLAELARRGISTALITRNSRSSVRTVLARHGLKIEVLITRDDAPAKPSPEPLRLACQRLGVEAANAVMIGDGHHDIEAGIAAGIRTIWISHGRPRDFAAVPWRVVRDLQELHRLVPGSELNL